MRRGGKESGWLANRLPNSNKAPEAEKEERPKPSSRSYLGKGASGWEDETGKILRKKLIQRHQCISTTFQGQPELQSEPRELAALCLWPAKKQAQRTPRRIGSEAKRLFSFNNGNTLTPTSPRLFNRNRPNENKRCKRQRSDRLQCV